MNRTAVVVQNKECKGITTSALFLITLLSLAFTSCQSLRPLLTDGDWIRQRLEATSPQEIRLLLKQGQYARVTLEPRGIRIGGEVYNAQHQPITEFVCAEYQPISFSLVAANEGSFYLRLYSLETDGTPGEYLVKLSEVRAALASDTSRLEAEKNYMAAEKLRLKWESATGQQAILKYEEACRYWQTLPDRLMEAETLRKCGQVQYQLGNTFGAKEKFLEAIQVSLENNDEWGQAQALIHLSELYLQLDESKIATEKAQQAYAIGRKLNSQLSIAQAQTALGESEAARNFQAALASLGQANLYWKEIGNRKQMAVVYRKIGQVHYYKGEFNQAINAYTQSFQLARNLKLLGEEISAINLLSLTYSVIGEKQQALKYNREAEVLAQKTDNQLIKARLLGGMAFVYEELGEPEKALPLRQESLRIQKLLGAPSSVASAQLCLAEVQLSLQEPELALANFEEALGVYRHLSNQMMEPIAIRLIGSVYEAQGKWGQALFQFQKALSLYLPGTQERWKAYLLMDHGRVLQKLRRFREAEEFFAQALEQNRKVEDKGGESQTRYHLARFYQAQGQLPRALSEISAAIQLIESLRSKVISQELRTSYFASVNQLFALSVDMLIQQHQLSSGSQFATEALSVNEQSRARSLLDLLHEARHEIKQGVDPQLLDQEQSIQQTLNGKADRKLQFTNQKGKEEDLAAVSKEIDDLTMQLDEVRSQIRATSPRYASLTQPQPLKATEIQQLLEDNTLLLEYALGDERSYLWAVTRNSLAVYTLPSRATIEAMVREVHQLMTAQIFQENESAAAWDRRVTQADQQYWSRAAALSALLLGPVAETLSQQRLLIVGEGALQMLPFAALPKPVVGSQWPAVAKNQPPALDHQPLIVAHEITYLPSASSLKLLRENRVQPPAPRGWFARWRHSLRSWLGRRTEAASLRSVAVLADPVFEKDDKRVEGQTPSAAQINESQRREVDLSNENIFLPRLFATLAEAAEIQKAAGPNPVLLKHGFAVNRALLASEELHPYGIIHFATHGFWDSRNPEMSGLFLSRFDQQGNKLDGTLRLSDVYNLILPKELVVLSACETAVGKDIRGEGLIALTRGFMYAGAARVMASLWKVDDAATAEMMKIFYQHLLQDQMTPAAALRQAQIAMWQKDAAAVPYHWAAFILQGEYR